MKGWCFLHLPTIFCAVHVTQAHFSYECHKLRKKSRNWLLSAWVFFCIQDALSPPSDGDNLSDSTNNSDAMSGGGLDDTPSVRRSVSFKERRKIAESETLTKRRNSDIDLQVGGVNSPLTEAFCVLDLYSLFWHVNCYCCPTVDEVTACSLGFKVQTLWDSKLDSFVYWGEP